MLIMLMDSLIEQGHEVFQGKGPASFLKGKVRRAIEHGSKAIRAATVSMEAWRAKCSGLRMAPRGPN